MAKKRASAPRRALRKPAGRAAASEMVEASTEGVSQADSAWRLERPFRLSHEDIVQGLRTGALRPALETLFGEAELAELQELLRERDAVRRGAGPRVLVLPGIMGSALGRARSLLDDTVWFDPIDVVRGGLRQLSLDGSGHPEIKALDVLPLYYLKLRLRLERAGFEVEYFPFDWRRSTVEAAKALLPRLKAMAEAADAGALHLVAHSMGGFVLREGLGRAAASAAWKSIQPKLGRVITLGTPHGGSFSAVQLFRGTHNTLRKLSRVDLSHSAEDLVKKVFSTFPGIYELLPAAAISGTTDWFLPTTWPVLHDENEGLGPRHRELLAAGEVVRARPPLGHPTDAIVGINQRTVIEIELKGSPEEDLLTIANHGDGTVPTRSAHWEGANHYYVAEEHGALPRNAAVAQTIIDLIRRGESSALVSSAELRGGSIEKRRAGDLLEPLFEGRRGGAITAREQRALLTGFLSPVGVDQGHVGAAPRPQQEIGVSAIRRSREAIVFGRERQRRLEIRIAHGSVTQIDARALVLGLYQGVAPSGPAAAIDRQIDGAITEFTQRRMFDGGVGEIFIMPTGRHAIAPEMVVFAGLGTYDGFDPRVLRVTAEHVVRTLGRTKVEDFATVLIGSGSGTDLETSLEFLIRGFLDGLKELSGSRGIRTVTICEYDRARYLRLQMALDRLATTDLFDDFEVTIDEVPPKELRADYAAARGEGLKERSRRDPNYLFVRTDPSAKAKNLKKSVEYFVASLLTAGHGATVISVPSEYREDELEILLSELPAITTLAEQEKLARRFTELMMPAAIREVLSARHDDRLVLITDPAMSKIPWELIQVAGRGSSPEDRYPALKTGLSRKYDALGMAPAKWLQRRRLAKELRVLLIVDPTGDLPGAAREGVRLQDLFKDPSKGLSFGAELKVLSKKAATREAILDEIGSGQYDILHYAGHAKFDQSDRSASGILCAGRELLMGRDLTGLGQLPALMIFNACESGRTRKGSLAKKAEQRDLETFSLAEAFLRGGVGNFIGTYWEVGDAAAERFALSLYAQILAGETLSQALLRARRDLRESKSIDWANYIHYGSAEFRVKDRDEIANP